jgi:hypothetical protein
LKQIFDVMDIKTHLIERPDRRSPYHAFKFIVYEVIDLLLILSGPKWTHNITFHLSLDEYSVIKCVADVTVDELIVNA